MKEIGDADAQAVVGSRLRAAGVAVEMGGCAIQRPRVEVFGAERHALAQHVVKTDAASPIEKRHAAALIAVCKIDLPAEAVADACREIGHEPAESVAGPAS